VSPEYLAEVTEAEARGRVAEIYEEIRRTVGSPVVNLVYRHLALQPARFEAVWSELRPNLASAAAGSGAERLVERATLPGVAPIPPRALAAIGVGAERTRLAWATLDTYARANSRNVLGMQALLHGSPGRRGNGDGGAEEEPSSDLPILPMADLTTVPPATLALLDDMSATLVGGEEPRLVPSLLRHFASDAPLLALLWTSLRPAAESSLGAQRLAAAADARDLAGRLPHRVSKIDDSALRETAEQFVVAMSAMLVAGEGIRTALG
jgi:hypothetical protein